MGPKSVSARGLVSTALTREIDNLLEEVRGEPNYFLFLADSVDSFLKNSGNLHKWWAARPAYRESIHKETETSTSGEIRDISNANIAQMRQIWSYLRSHLRARALTTSRYLSSHSLVTLASLIDPKNRGFRPCNKKAEIFEDVYSAPPAFQVPVEMEKLLQEIRYGGAHPVCQATQYHLGIVAIQPFERGNKRLARLVQNSVLVDHGFPPPIIAPEDVERYNPLLRDALTGYQEGDTRMQKPFHEYLADKVRTTMTRFKKDKSRVGLHRIHRHKVR